jgi:uncharacterized membrane protein YedE/YeeE
MVDPARVAGFLDITGQWQSALALVMGGTIVVAALAFWRARHRAKFVLGTPFALPDRFTSTRRFVLRAVLFGIGWGLSSICPGPGLILLTALSTKALVFVATLAAGVFLTVAWRAKH